MDFQTFFLGCFPKMFVPGENTTPFCLSRVLNNGKISGRKVTSRLVTLVVDSDNFLSRKRADCEAPSVVKIDYGIVLCRIGQFIHHIICRMDFPREEKEIGQYSKLYQVDKDVCITYY